MKMYGLIFYRIHFRKKNVHVQRSVMSTFGDGQRLCNIGFDVDVYIVFYFDVDLERL